MKYFVIADIHGNTLKLKSALECFEEELCDKIIILGDILYHGARNLLPDSYDTIKTAEILNNYKDKIIGIKGNCDSEVDEMVLAFSLRKHHSFMIGKRLIFITHGHEFNENNLPTIKKNDILLYGHLHYPFIIEKNEILIASPGSVGIPKNNSVNAYMILDDKGICIKDFSKKIILEKLFAE